MSIVRFNENHQWVRLDGSEAVVGITDYAQTQLGEIVSFMLTSRESANLLNRATRSLP
jgi:glycine cleavage system H lipoate-binding protein